MDFDFYSVKTRVADLVLLSPTTVTLSSRKLASLKDPRVVNFLQITSTPMCVFADVEKDRFIQALVDSEGLVVHPNGHENVLSSTTSFPVATEKVIEGLNRCGVSHVYCYAYGYKAATTGVFFEAVNTCAINGGAHDNVFDIGCTIPSASIPLFRVATSLGETWPALKHLGAGHGGVRFKYSDWVVTLYQKLAHRLKALGPKLNVPRTYREVHNFSRKCSEFIDWVGDREETLSGARLEIQLRAPCLAVAVAHVEDRMDLQFWQDVGVNVRYVAVGAYIQTARYANGLARSLGCFIGRNEGVCPYHVQCILADLINFLGWSQGWLKNFIARTGFTEPPFTTWQEWMIRVGSVRIIDNPNVNEFGEWNVREMVKKLKVSRVTRGEGYTLTVRQSSSRWSASVGARLDDTKVNDCAVILRDLIRAVMNHGIRNWREHFCTLDEPSGFRVQVLAYLAELEPDFVALPPIRPDDVDQLETDISPPTDPTPPLHIPSPPVPTSASAPPSREHRPSPSASTAVRPFSFPPRPLAPFPPSHTRIIPQIPAAPVPSALPKSTSRGKSVMEVMASIVSAKRREALSSAGAKQPTPSSSSSSSSSYWRVPDFAQAPPPLLSSGATTAPVASVRIPPSVAERKAASAAALEAMQAVNPNYRVGHGLEFTLEQDNILLRRGQEFVGSSIDWDYVIGDDFPNFTRKQVQDRRAYLMKKRKREREE